MSNFEKQQAYMQEGLDLLIEEEETTLGRKMTGFEYAALQKGYRAGACRMADYVTPRFAELELHLAGIDSDLEAMDDLKTIPFTASKS